MSNWARTNFAIEEVDQLEAEGWNVSRDNLSVASDGGWKRIVKRCDNLYVVQLFMDDPEANGGWWETDSEWPILTDALKHT